MIQAKVFTRKTQLHEACSYSYIVVRSDGETNQPAQYRASDAAEHLLLALQEEAKTVLKKLSKPKKAIVTTEDNKKY